MNFVSIDEYDKLTEEERKELHEYMEKQVVTINKKDINLVIDCKRGD